MAFCLGTFVELLDQILHPQQYHQNWVLDSDKIPQIQSLFQKASFLREFLANSTPAIQASIETLEDLVRGAAENAEDILDSYIKAQVLSSSVYHMPQRLFEKASFLSKRFTQSTPTQADFEMLEDVIRGVAENVEDIVESYTKDQAIDHENIPQIQSLSGNSLILNDFLAKSGPLIQDVLVTLEGQDLPWLYDIIFYLAGQIRDTAENVQDLVLSYPNSSGQIFMISPPDMSEVIQVFDSATAEMMKIADEGGLSVNTSSAVTSRRSSYSTSNDVLVGVDKCLIKLNDQLTSHISTLEIIPIVGMGGIGKTTLARKLYDEYSLGKHFDICLWATVSQEYDRRQVILSLLGCVKGKLTTEISRKKTEELEHTLYQELFQRRYLIVLDDIWSSKVWDDVQKFFPKGYDNSRIILTTRRNDVADYVSSRRHEMQLLNKEDSWELFRKIVHAGEECPNELEGIAQEIVRKCRGLPLALQVIGGFMSRAERMKDLWERVADDISSFIAKEDDQFSAIFSWSYANLPHYLKPCLLYIGATYPGDFYAMHASKLIKLWVAEGFLNPIEGKSPEEVAEMYLNALIDRNLIFVLGRTFSGRAKSYGIHDLLRDLCMRKAEENRFVFTKTLGASRDDLCICRVSVSSYEQLGNSSSYMELMTQARSFGIVGMADEFMLPKNGFEHSLLRVLDTCSIRFHLFPEEISKLVKLKYLALSSKSDCKSPSSIAVLENLQTIILDIPDAFNFVRGISHLKQLRHLKSIHTINWSPHRAVPRSFSLGETLQSLAYVTVPIVTQLLGKLPNLKKLGIDFKGCCLCDRRTERTDLTSFPGLETIKIRNIYPNHNPIFPQTLRKLKIERGMLPWTFMSGIGGLPNLQLLRLQACQFETSTWEPSDGEFCNLQYLHLSVSNLENWVADETHFPQLKHLFVEDCYSLKEIPFEFGGIETLEVIQLGRCKPSVFDSARSILQNQSDFGNDNFILAFVIKPRFNPHGDRIFWDLCHHVVCGQLRRPMGFTDLLADAAPTAPTTNMCLIF